MGTAQQYMISRRGAQHLEAYANGLNRGELQSLLYLTLNSIKTHTSRLHARLHIPDECSDPVNRSIAVAIAGGLLQAKDLKAPGAIFNFTMRPETDSIWRIRRTKEASVNPSFRMPKISDEHLGTRTLNPWQRTCLSALALGMSFSDMAASGMDVRKGDDGTAGLARWKHRARTAYLQLGVRNAPHAIAHAAFLGAIDLNPETIPVYDPAAEMSPVIYLDSVDVQIDRPAYYIPPHRQAA